MSDTVSCFLPRERAMRETYHVQKWLCEITVQFSQTVGKLGNVDSDELVWILDPIVQSRDTVKG